MMAPTAHELVAAMAFAEGKSTVDLLLASRDDRLAAIALGLRHPIYARWPGGLGDPLKF